MTYKGWSIGGSGKVWGASLHGVHMSGNSEALIKEMIDLKIKTEKDRLVALSVDYPVNFGSIILRD